MTIQTSSAVSLPKWLLLYFQVTVLDLPGFGKYDRLPLEYSPALYTQFLQDFVAAIFETPVAVAAAGHAAGYVLNLAAHQRTTCSKLVLVAPTWRGPLAVMGVSPVLRSGITGLVRTPLLGQALYGLKTQPAFLKWMYRRHVFVDEQHLTQDYIQQRRQSTQRPGLAMPQLLLSQASSTWCRAERHFYNTLNHLPVR